MRIKICGITKPEQGRAIADLGATALGFICVSQTSRYVTPDCIRTIIEQLPENLDCIGVFVNSSEEEISQITTQTGLTGVQLHGDESPEFCRRLRQMNPKTEIVKAFRIKSWESLLATNAYFDCVDTFLFDAYHPHAFGGTGKTLDWDTLLQFCPVRPWLLAGGLTPDNILEALQQLSPSGIDLSSGVERSPGDKDLEKVARLFQQLAIGN
ncbi:phosphoribosylanthranilate isomerase [Candidatus Gracilibacteria bacterium]|nr:phosphoribosylanthranilate isomerase [Candidatus Gracilibacteria bacterium]NJP22033.1 phosphoribosylanthranilate isomerase [Hydrococcus sp. CRU_1_1]NJQ97168.1 phosphoribosylanthranilate isomerase [Hydrococcus sp. CSU_1_8]